MTCYFGKELFFRFTASAFRTLPSIYVFSYFPFGFEGRVWDLIVSVPDHCLSFYFPLLIQMFIKVASSPRLSGIGMPSPILWSHLLKMQRIVLLSLLLWWELGTNSLFTGPGEWLSFRRFTSKLPWSWSWSWSVVERVWFYQFYKFWMIYVWLRHSRRKT